MLYDLSTLLEDNEDSLVIKCLEQSPFLSSVAVVVELLNFD